MGGDSEKPSGPDLTLGIPEAELADGRMIAGHVGDEAVLLARRGDEVFAVAAACTHYSAPLAEGLLVGRTVRCPWHHAAFDLGTGEAVRAPALAPLACWRVERRQGRIFVRDKVAPRKPARRVAAERPRNVVIVGGGAAGLAAAETLRRAGFAGSVAMLSADDAPPCDRPNLSKDYLAGKAPEDWIPLKPRAFYEENHIDLRLGTRVAEIDVENRRVVTTKGTFGFDRLLLATGAEPVRLDVPGADRPHVHVLRSLADCRAIIADAERARRAVVLGASFIGLEVAASLRAREIEVHVVAPDERPFERVFGPELGDAVRALHEQHGVTFHLRRTAAEIEDGRVRLDNGDSLEADLVVVGIGVRPHTRLAERAGLAVDNGVVVSSCLETSVPGIFAAGDIARWPDPRTRETIRVEHWVVAERQGQTAALNMLGLRARFAAVPFFWSQHYDVPINYVGHAGRWDSLDIEGDVRGLNCLVRYRRDGRVLAVASISRDIENLEAEVEMERAVVGSGLAEAAAEPGAAPVER